MVNVDLKRESILESATKVFAEKGFINSTISEIAKGAGIADSAVYQHFKGKEDILFTIPEYHMTLYLSNLQEQLEGIKGSHNKLRKLIWYHCKHFTINREYTQVLLIECRPNPRFYNSKAYILIKDYSKLIRSIIEDGMNEGIICGLSSQPILRDMILGTIDHVSLYWIMTNGPTPLNQSEMIYDFIIRAAKIKQYTQTALDAKVEKKRRITNAATEIFARKGYNDSTISKIAKKAEVSEGIIYGYYKNKEHLLISIPEEKLRELLSYINETSIEYRFKKMILDCFRFFNNNRDCATILVLMLRPNANFYNSKSNKLLNELSNALRNVIIEGQKQKLFSNNIDVDLFIHLICGTMDHIIIPWIIFKRRYDLLQIGEEVSKLLINAIRA